MTTAAVLPIPVWPENDHVFSLTVRDIPDASLTPGLLAVLPVGSAAFFATSDSPTATAAGSPALTGTVELMTPGVGDTSSKLRIGFDRAALPYASMHAAFSGTPLACFLIVDLPGALRVAVPCAYFDSRDAALVNGKIVA